MSVLFRAIGALVRWLRPGRRSRSAMDSVVVLFDRAPSFSDAEIVAAIRRAFPVHAPKILPSTEMPPPDDAADAPPCRSVPFAVNRRVLGLLIGSFPYVQASAEDLGASPMTDAERAVVEHRGWIAVDFIAGEPPEDMYGLLGQVVAEFVGEGALLVYLPDLSLAARPTSGLLEGMRAGQWVDRLSVLAGTMQRPQNDPSLAAAGAEARARFGEFVDAFVAGTGTDFSAKFPFADGDQVEHMWIAVSSIDGEVISGTLGNEPTIVGNIREGDPVVRRLEELEDWLYMNGQEMVGGFSVRVLLGEDGTA